MDPNGAMFYPAFGDGRLRTIVGDTLAFEIVGFRNMIRKDGTAEIRLLLRKTGGTVVPKTIHVILDTEILGVAELPIFPPMSEGEEIQFDLSVYPPAIPS